MERRTGALRLAGFGLLFLLALLPRWGAISRSGYSPDEEVTVFAVRGISSSGLPRLPSGLFYNRGVLYSYASWASGRLLGDELPSYRIPSLAGGCAAVLLTAVLATRLDGSGLLAGVLAAAAAWMVAILTWARFYGLFVAAFVATTLAFRGGVFTDPDHSLRFRGSDSETIAARLLDYRFNTVPESTDIGGTFGAGIMFRNRFQVDVAASLSKDANELVLSFVVRP